MSVLGTLTGKEIRALFVSPIAYAVLAVFIILSGYTFTVSLFVSKQATLVHIFFQAAVQLILLVPLITMRQFAEERRSGTLELLLTSPVREFDIVASKFLACMTVLAAMTGLTLVCKVTLALTLTLVGLTLVCVFIKLKALGEIFISTCRRATIPSGIAEPGA